MASSAKVSQFEVHRKGVALTANPMLHRNYSKYTHIYSGTRNTLRTGTHH